MKNTYRSSMIHKTKNFNFYSQKFMNGATNLLEVNYRIHVANIKALLNFKDKCNGPSLRDDQTIVFPDRNRKRMAD